MSESRSGGFFDRLADWFFAPAPLQPMVLNRIVLGSVLFLHAASRLPEFAAVYGSQSGAWSDPYRDFVGTVLGSQLALPLLPVVAAVAELAPAVRGPVVASLYAALLVSAGAFLLGFCTRLAGALAVVLHVFFLSLHPLSDWSWAQLIVPFAFYVVLSRAGEVVSLDGWRARRRGAPVPTWLAPAWPLRLLQIHVAVMYFHTGVARIDDPGWLHGDVLFEALAHTTFSRFDIDWYAWKAALVPLAYATFVLEPVAAFALWIPRLRTICALALLAMHAILELFTNVGWWNFMMAGGVACFLPAAWLSRLLPGSPRRAE